MLYPTVDGDVNRSHDWLISQDAEIDAIKRFHATQAADESFTGHHLIGYRNSQRLVRIGVRPFDEYAEKHNAFANMFMMVPVLNFDTIVLFSDVWMRAVDLEASASDTLQPQDDPMSPSFVPPSRSKDRQEAITIITMDHEGYDTIILPYKRHEGAIIWQDELNHLGAFIPFETDEEKDGPVLRIEELLSSSYLIRMMRDSLKTPKPDGVSEATAFWMLENQNYQVKKYSN